MLHVEAPFPQVGSYALLEENNKTQLIRIQQRDQEGNATISFPARVGASGNRTVPLASLQDATPLSDKERRELAELDAKVIGRDSPPRKAKARWSELRCRDIRSETMNRMLADLKVPA